MTTLKYRLAHKKEIKNYNKEYYSKHKYYFKEFGKNRDKEKHKLICHEWRKRNCHNHSKASKAWRKKNPLKAKVHWQRRRILLKSLNLKTIQLVYENNIKRYGALTCYLCLKPVKFGQDHLEHKIPLCRDGDNAYENLAVSCKICNLRKWNKTEEEFRSLNKI